MSRWRLPYRSQVAKTANSETGVSLLELLFVLAMLAILTYTGLSLVATLTEDSRVLVTRTRLEKIRDALVGDPAIGRSAERMSFGFWGDIGAEPNAIADLITQPPGIPNYAVDATSRQGVGWRGPYLSNDFLGEDLSTDAWGRAWVTDYTASTWTVKSLGSDGAVGGVTTASDLVLSIPSFARKSQIYGVITDPADNAISVSADLELSVPDGAGGIQVVSQSITAGDAGVFSFSDVPMGWRSLRIYVPDKTSPTQQLGPVLFLADQPHVALKTAHLKLSGFP